MLLKKLEEAAEGTYSLLEQLLTWSKTQRNKITFQPVELNLSEIISEIFLLLKQSAHRKQIELHSHIPEKTSIRADKHMLHTILRNLLSNAIKFSFYGGDVIVACRKKTKGFIEISVKDEGIGIPKQEIPKVLFIEEQYRQKGTDNEEGTGLGLMLCKDFVEKHGGQLLLTSDEGKGTTVTITLPSVT
jgi:signal transduction histidine kinase